MVVTYLLRKLLRGWHLSEVRLLQLRARPGRHLELLLWGRLSRRLLLLGMRWRGHHLLLRGRL